MKTNFQDNHFIQTLIPMATDLSGDDVSSNAVANIANAKNVAILLTLSADTVAKPHLFKVHAAIANKTKKKSVDFVATPLAADGTYGAPVEVSGDDGYNILAATLTDGVHKFLFELKPIEFNNNDDFATDITYVVLQKTSDSESGTFTGSAELIKSELAVKG